MSVAAWFRRLTSPRAFLPRESVLAFALDPLLGCMLDAALRPAGFDVLLADTVEGGLVTHWQRHRDIALVVVCEPMPGLSLPQLLAGLRGADASARCCVWDAGSHDGADAGAVRMAPPATVEAIRRALLPLARPPREERPGTAEIPAGASPVFADAAGAVTRKLVSTIRPFRSKLSPQN